MRIEPPLVPVAELAAGFLLMDLSFYYRRVANHKVPFLWRFHNVHRIDPDLDVTTGFRFHPGSQLHPWSPEPVSACGRTRRGGGGSGGRRAPAARGG